MNNRDKFELELYRLLEQYEHKQITASFFVTNVFSLVALYLTRPDPDAIDTRLIDHP